MCGIVAAWGREDQGLVWEMLGRVRHRGPDGIGVKAIGNGVLGHVRLAILDAPGGAQPMANERDDLAIAFNGEIYNHLELRRQIEKRHTFRSRTDTEVLLHLYEEEAEDMLPRLDGMFALALAGPEGLLLARDPLGIKPLYYGWKNGIFLAASEVKAFPVMDDLHVLPAGHALHVGPRTHSKALPGPENSVAAEDLRIFSQQISGAVPWAFALPFPPQPRLASPALEETLMEVRRRLEGAVTKRLMADVPVGVFLSGGLDSSLVAALMRPHVVSLHSFATGMEGAPDLEAARKVAAYLETDHHELVYTPEDALGSLPEIVGHLESFDAPLVRSAVPMYFISRLAAKTVKVVLSGEGADELFAGYAYLKSLEGGGRIRRELDDMTVRLQDTNLQRGDRMSMAHGLEARVPFLDRDLVRYVSRIPEEWLRPRPDRPEKWLLREACRGLLPTEILNRPKMKFSEGTGSAAFLSALARREVTEEDFEKKKEVAPGLVVRSREELLYYRIWQERMGANARPDFVGRTLDRSAAAAP